MATVKKRAWTHKGVEKTAWVVQYNDSDGKQRMKTFQTKREANIHRLQIETEIDLGTHVADSETLTFNKAADEWLKDCERRNIKTGRPCYSTIETFRWCLNRHVRPTFGKALATKVSSEQVADWLADNARALPYDTLRAMRFAVNQVLQYCVRTKRLRRNPLRDDPVKLPGRAKRVVVPSMKEIEALLAILEQRSHREQMLAFLQRRAFVYLALYAGLRMGEICALDWGVVKLEARTLEIRHSYSIRNGLKETKTESGLRDVHMVEPLFVAMSELKAFLGVRAQGSCFRTKAGKQFYTATVHAIIWKPLLERAGLIDPPRGANTRHGRPKFHFHALRHANVSLLIAQGLPAINIARHIGHANATTTLNVYGHMFPEDRRVAQGLDAISKGLKMARAMTNPISG